MTVDEGEVRRVSAVDMSPAAIARRLRRLDELFRLGLSLSRARRLGPVERESAASTRVEPERPA